jgi:hypothetical protein
MTPDDYTDPTKWMEHVPPVDAGTSFLGREFISEHPWPPIIDKWKGFVLHDPKPVKVGLMWHKRQFTVHPPKRPTPQSPGESGFDLED